MSALKSMKLPNGYGSVYKLSGSRRKPYIARKTKAIIDGKQTYIIVGYYATKEEALQALAEYNLSPIVSTGMTFSELYNLWSKEHFQNTVPSVQRSWLSAYNHSKPLHNLKFTDIRPSHMELCLKQEDIGEATKQRMKSLYNLMYKYALKNDICRKDYASLVKLERKPKTASIHSSFTSDELLLLWKKKNVKNVDMVLIGIYSGWRPQELCNLKISDINLEERTMKGGLKTEAGRNRTVPIHSSILPLISARISEAEEIPSEYLFNDLPTQTVPHLTYDRYRHKWDNLMKILKLSHRPHDTRHTFITLAKESGVDEYALKRMVGHAMNDITEAVYTHHTNEFMSDQIEKIKVFY